MKVGQLVMLVGADGFMPPLGAVGEIVGPLDETLVLTYEIAAVALCLNLLLLW